MKQCTNELNRAFSKEEVQMAKKTNEKKLTIPDHKRNTNQNHIKIPVRIATIKNTNTTKCWQRCGIKGTLKHCWWKCKLVQPLWKTIWRLLKKLNIELPYDPVILLLVIYTQL
jgi:hypothetical protein